MLYTPKSPTKSIAVHVLCEETIDLYDNRKLFRLLTMYVGGKTGLAQICAVHPEANLSLKDKRWVLRLGLYLLKYTAEDWLSCPVTRFKENPQHNLTDIKSTVKYNDHTAVECLRQPVQFFFQIHKRSPWSLTTDTLYLKIFYKWQLIKSCRNSLKHSWDIKSPLWPWPLTTGIWNLIS